MRTDHYVITGGVIERGEDDGTTRRPWHATIDISPHPPPPPPRSFRSARPAAVPASGRMWRSAAPSSTRWIR